MQGEDTNRDTFIDLVVSHLGRDGYVRLVNAYQLYKALHRGQDRRDGSRYVTHPRAVAQIMLEYGPSSFDEVIIALLHDTVEDAHILPGFLALSFGADVALGVQVLSKYTVTLRDHGFIEKVKLSNAEYYRRLATAPRFVQRPKFGDRLHNLRTMESMGEEHQRRQVAETREFILPIADKQDLALAVALERQCVEWERVWDVSF